MQTVPHAELLVIALEGPADADQYYHAGQIDYLPFFLGSLITEFGNNYRNRFFPGGLFLNLVIITDRCFPQGSHFRVR